MNIVLAGDSWGFPNYSCPRGAPAKTHLFYLLENAGHHVVNVSNNGGWNFDSIQRVFDYFAGDQHIDSPDRSYTVPKYDGRQYDYIIWFHTTPLRDIARGLTTSEQDYYSVFNSKINKMRSHAKVIGIGGCAKFSNQINKSLFHYCIEDWKADIIDENLPDAYWWGLKQQSPRMLFNWLLPENRTSIQDLIEECITVEGLITDELFPDGGHPGIQPHKDLLQRLTKDVFLK